MADELRCACRSLSKAYGRRTAVHDCTLDIRGGESVGLVGENGSGKSTLIRCLLGFTAPTSGTTWVCPSVGYCPQENYLNRRLTVREHFRLLAELYRLRGDVDDSFLQDMIERMNLPPYLPLQVGELSSGTYQKVKFVTSIFHRPNLLVLDEPTDGFDWRMYQTFWEIMTEVKEWKGALLMVSHLLYERDKFDRILEMKDGHCDQTR